jgi:hypothetical protein
VSATLLARLLAAERTAQRDACHVRRMYRDTGMGACEVSYYGARVAWPDAVELVRGAANARSAAIPY